jgi:hypothetical protein
MEPATENLAHAPRQDLVWLARVLLELAQERSLEGVLRKAIDAEATLQNSTVSDNHTQGGAGGNWGRIAPRPGWRCAFSSSWRKAV